MLMAVTFLTLLTRIPYGITILRSCVPNTQFLLNGRLCYCNSIGQSSDASCQLIGPKHECQPGQVIWEDCSQCICQDTGKLLCTNSECPDSVIKSRVSPRRGSAIWCTPYRSYYVNCSLCVCPASGKISEARCATDSSCTLKGLHTLDKIPQNICIPKVMYLFTCLQCQCSDDGLFLKNKCIETCHKPSESGKRCIPKSFYKADCNVCRCPDTGVPDPSLCSTSTCGNAKPRPLTSLRNMSLACTPNKYTKPKCLYCECTNNGVVDDQLCFEQECLRVDDFNYDSVKSTCSAGELVPICMECFCPRSKLTIEKFCTRVCSPQNKLAILENVLKEKVELVDRTLIQETAGTDSCEPDALFLDQGRYCLCSGKGDTSIKMCTSVLEDTVPKKPSKIIRDNNSKGSSKIDLNMTCERNTYVEFGCNSCYCNKEGKIDIKWCTSDDCESKKAISDINNKARSGVYVSKVRQELVKTTTCVPGSVSKIDCNFCICGNSGLLANRTCTKNVCHGKEPSSNEQFHCEPSSYYTVDCNMCYCPSNGIKNVHKCTKNQCETNFLRSVSCTPGELFCDECSVCVCPPSGHKIDKICTNRTCGENDIPWKKIFKISQDLLGNKIPEDTKNFEPCYPGEEFEIGCKVCVCSETGLKQYAPCSGQLCDDEPTAVVPEIEADQLDEFKEDRISSLIDRTIEKFDIGSGRREATDLASKKDAKAQCTPGSEYIINCQVCVCPYIGSKDSFCRPMPRDQYCEEAYPGISFSVTGRRRAEVTKNVTSEDPIELPAHNHTRYTCEGPGPMRDECFLCHCEDKQLVEQHCFKSGADSCINVTTPSFLSSQNIIV